MPSNFTWLAVILLIMLVVLALTVANRTSMPSTTIFKGGAGGLLERGDQAP
jgi:hypothetical protein